MKKTSVLLLTAIMLFSMIIPASAAALPFSDVPADSWYAPYVQYVYDNGLMNGTRDTAFSPDDNMTRAMVVTVLYRIAGEPFTIFANPFSDVPIGEWYDNPVTWAYTNGIVTGVSETTFAPLANITREQLVTIFYRYASISGYNTSNLSSLSGYSDSTYISSYALTAFQWAVANGIITGTDGTHLTPSGNATRAQCAAIIQRYIAWTENNGAMPPSSDGSGATIAETVIFDKDDIAITVKGLIDDRTYGKSIKLFIENGSDRDITFSGSYFVVNGITMNGGLYVDVSAGKKVNTTIFFMENLDDIGVTDIATVENYDACIYDADTYGALYEVPFSLRSSIAESYVQKINASGEVIFAENGITAIAEYDSDPNFGSSVQFLIKNDTNRAVNVEADQVSINDYMVHSWMHETIYPGTVSYCSFEIYDSDLREYGIESIKEIEFKLGVYDSEFHYVVAESDELQILVAE